MSVVREDQPSAGDGTIRARLEAKMLSLKAQVQTCEHILHTAPLGCPYCQRDTKLIALLRDAAAALPVVAPLSELIAFITAKRDDAETARLARVDAAHAWRQGDDASHAHARRMAEGMGGRKLPKQSAPEREEMAARADRIAAKYGDEVKLFDAVLVGLAAPLLPALRALEQQWRTTNQEWGSLRGIVQNECADQLAAAQRVLGASAGPEPTIREWLKSKNFIDYDNLFAIAWSCRSGYDFTVLEFFDNGDGTFEAIVGHHASGTNPRLCIGRCDSLADVQMAYETLRRLNGYPQPEDVQTSAQ